MRRPGRVAGLLLVPALAGCAGLRASPRSPIADHEASIARLEQVYAADKVASCLATVPPDKACRDQIVQALIIAIDLRYADYELGFFDTNRYGGFAATVATLGLGAAGAVSGAGTTQVLSAVITAITGTREAFNREILAEQTSSALLTAMRAQRNIVSLRIRDGLRAPEVSDYPLGIAMADVYAYFRAGTIVGALTGVTQAVGVQGQLAQDELRSAIPITRTSAALFLQSLIGMGTEAARAANEAAIRKQMRAEGIPDRITVARFTRTGTPEQLERTASGLGWRP